VKFKIATATGQRITGNSTRACWWVEKWQLISGFSGDEARSRGRRLSPLLRPFLYKPVYGLSWGLEVQLGVQQSSRQASLGWNDRFSLASRDFPKRLLLRDRLQVRLISPLREL